MLKDIVTKLVSNDETNLAVVGQDIERAAIDDDLAAIGRRIETPFMNIAYRSTRGAQFSKGKRPPDTPYIRGFAE